jgi:phage shock protein PspC (stress-responsive transcriptional regulator)
MLCDVSTQQTSSINVEETVKDFWASRPRRPQQGRMVAGVAAGIGRRYGIDPIIVRIALVVSAIYGGSGVLFYLLGWLFFAGEGDEVSAFEGLIHRGRSSVSPGLTVLLCILVFPAVIANLALDGYSLLAGSLLLFGGLFLLHRYRSDMGPTEAVTPGATGPEAGPMTDSTPTSALDPESGPQDRVPPAWDPLGAAPFAWDLPEPTPAQPEPAPVPVSAPRHRSRIGLATFGLALVVGAVLWIIAPGGGWLNLPHIVGILGAVVGIGLVAGSFVRGGRGLIPLAILLSGASFVLTAGHIDGWHGAGDTAFNPSKVADVQPVYQRTVGILRLDLTQLPNSGTVHTTVDLGAGSAVVLVPPSADVVATCSVRVGNVNCLGQRESGANSPAVHATQNDDGTNRLRIFLNVQAGTGTVRVASDTSAIPEPPIPPLPPAPPTK